jgi:3-dehydroquinate dehydratase-2
MEKRILVIHGPNLNMLGTREPTVYGNTTLDSINKELLNLCFTHNVTIEFFQSNSEAELVTKTQQSLNKYDFLIINPAGLTHTSIVWRDAVLAVALPFIEVHLSNIYSREPFRHHSYFSDIAIGVISGLGKNGYKLALSYAIEYLTSKE